MIRNILILIFMIMVVSMLDAKSAEAFQGKTLSIVCVNGIQYYYSADHFSGFNGIGYSHLAPVIDSKTLTYKKCEIKVKKK